MLVSGLNMRVSQKPPSPPPCTVPQYCPFLKNTGSEDIRQYLKFLVYVWTIYRNSFWLYPVEILGDVLFAYVWDGSDWEYIKLNINLIDSLY